MSSVRELVSSERHIRALQHALHARSYLNWIAKSEEIGAVFKVLARYCQLSLLVCR